MITRWTIDSRNDWRPIEDREGAYVLVEDVIAIANAWAANEQRIRALHLNHPTLGYDKLADLYGAAANELIDSILGAPEKRSQ